MIDPTDNNTLQNIEGWHSRARQFPTEKDFNVQLGCHLEEVVEMLEVLHTDYHFWHRLRTDLFELATRLKEGRTSASITDREAFVDALADQIVTAVGVGHCADMDVPLAAEIVDQSNWSKFVDGFPTFDANGKIAKPPTYQAPNLRGCF